MNFILTYDCDKGCPYCFAAEARSKQKGHRHMTMETFNKLLDKNDTNIKLLGGEPTQHPDFEEIVKELVKRKASFTLISNFLFNEETLKIILSAMKEIEIFFLVNATTLDIKDRIKTFSRNYNSIYNFLYSYDLEENITIGLTLEERKDYIYYLNYLDFLVLNIKKFEVLRLSLDMSEGSFNFINNKKYGEKLLYITRKAVEMGSLVSIDCNIYPCIFNNKEEFKYINNFSKKSVRFICDSAPSDIFLDEEVSYCYPLKDIKVDSKNFNRLSETSEALSIKYELAKSQVELPEECKICDFYKVETCDGPSLCFYEKEDYTI